MTDLDEKYENATLNVDVDLRNFDGKKDGYSVKKGIFMMPREIL